MKKRGFFYWLCKHESGVHISMIILPWIFRFLRPLDFLQTTCSDAFARFILRIGFLERNSAGREIYSRRRQTRTITKYRNYESFMDGSNEIETGPKCYGKKRPGSKWHSFHSCANNWSLKCRWMSIDVARKRRINTIPNGLAHISKIDFAPTAHIEREQCLVSRVSSTKRFIRL